MGKYLLGTIDAMNSVCAPFLLFYNLKQITPLTDKFAIYV